MFVRDMATGTTERVSVASGGVQVMDSSWGPSISADGRWIAFESRAFELAPGNQNSNLLPDVYVHDRQSHTTTRVSTDMQGDSAGGSQPSISADGRYVAFASRGVLKPEDLSGVAKIYVRDLQTSTTTLVSVSTSGVPGFGYDSGAPAISGDSHFVAFASDRSWLVPGGRITADVYVRDLVTGVTTLESVNSAGGHANNNSSPPSISDDGRYVAFHSDATNLVPGDTNTNPLTFGRTFDVFVRDRATGQTMIASVTCDGSWSNGDSKNARLSRDGRAVAFASKSSNIEASDTNTLSDVFLRVMATPPPGPTATPTPVAAATATHTPTATATIATATPTAMATPTLTATATATPTPTPSATTVVTFDELASPNRVLSGEFPTGVIDWGSNSWYLSAPWRQFTTNSVGFNGAGPTAANLTFVTPRRLVRLDAYNGGSGASTISLSCDGQSTITFVLTAGQLQTLSTNWTNACQRVTIGSSNGWDTNFDTLVLDTGT
ncbi:MAG TPA: hypothetical protein VGL99_22650 [Chloroflexota bacterium]